MNIEEEKIYFISVEDADEIIRDLAKRREVREWFNLSIEDKQYLLRQAGFTLNNLPFNGTVKVSRDQPYEFPRYLSLTVQLKPPVYKNYQDYQVAQALQAGSMYSLVNEDELDIDNESTKNKDIASYTVGSTSVSYYKSSGESSVDLAREYGLSLTVYKIIKDWLNGGY